MNIINMGAVSSQHRLRLRGWNYGSKIVVPADEIDSELSNFPLTVYLNDSNFDFSKAKADGSDIRFTDKNLNPLKFERKQHNKSGIQFSDEFEESIGTWVPISGTVSANLTTIYKHSGNKSIRFNNYLGTMPRIDRGIAPIKIQNGYTTVSFWLYIVSKQTDDHYVGFVGDAGGININLKREIASDCRLNFPGTSEMSTGLTLNAGSWYKFEVFFNGANSIIRILNSSESQLYSITANLSTTTSINAIYTQSDSANGWDICLDDFIITNGSIAQSAVYNVQLPTVSNLTDTEVYMWYGNENAYNTSIEAWQDQTGKSWTQTNFKLTNTYSLNKRDAQFYNSYEPFVLTSSSVAMGTDSFTIDFWVYPTSKSPTAWEGLIELCDKTNATTGNGNHIRVGYISSYGLGFVMPTGTVLSAISGTVLSDVCIYTNQSLTLNTWNHLALVRNNSNIKLFLNGVIICEGNVTTSVSHVSSRMILGSTAYSSDGYFAGGLGGIRITKGRARYTANFTPPTSFEIDGTDVVFCTNFDTVYDSNYAMVQHMGDTLVDASGNGNNGTATGTTVVNTDYGKARSFNGTSDRITNTTFNIGVNPIFTITSLLKAESASIGGATWGLGSDGNAISSYPSSDNKVSFDLYGYTTAVSTETHSSTEYFVSHHVKRNSTGIFAIPNLSAYINGNVATLNYTRGGSTTANISSGYAIGAVSYNSPYFGKFTMCESRISNIARSDAWIKAESLALKNNLLTITEL